MEYIPVVHTGSTEPFKKNSPSTLWLRWSNRAASRGIGQTSSRERAGHLCRGVAVVLWCVPSLGLFSEPPPPPSLTCVQTESTFRAPVLPEATEQTDGGPSHETPNHSGFHPPPTAPAASSTSSSSSDGNPQHLPGLYAQINTHRHTGKQPAVNEYTQVHREEVPRVKVAPSEYCRK